MKAIVERKVTRETVETKQKDFDIIYSEMTVREMRILGLKVFHKETSYACKEKEDESTLGFKRKKT